MNATAIASVVAGILALTTVILTFVLLRSSSTPKVLRGVLTYRRFGGKNIESVEQYERDTLNMTISMEVDGPRKTFTINTEGDSDDVRGVNDVFTRLLAASADGVNVADRDPGNGKRRLRSKFTIVSEEGSRSASVSTEAAIIFTVIDDDTEP